MKNVYLRMIDLLSKSLSNEGLSFEKSVDVSNRVVNQIRAELGGEYVYLPKKHPFQGTFSRKLTVKREFTGRNMLEVCRNHGISRRTVYRYLKK